MHRSITFFIISINAYEMYPLGRCDVTSSFSQECDRTDASNGSIKDGAKNKRPDPSPPNLPPPPVSPVAIEPEPVVKNAPKEVFGVIVDF